MSGGERQSEPGTDRQRERGEEKQSGSRVKWTCQREGEGELGGGSVEEEEGGEEKRKSG